MSFEEYARVMHERDTAISNMYDRGDGTCLIVQRLMFHWTLIISEVGDMDGYMDRFCYATQTGPNGAKDAAERWLSEGGAEPTMWHRHPKTGRRRPHGDPSKEYVQY